MREVQPAAARDFLKTVAIRACARCCASVVARACKAGKRYDLLIVVVIHSFDPSHTTCNQALTSQSCTT